MEGDDGKGPTCLMEDNRATNGDKMMDTTEDKRDDLSLSATGENKFDLKSDKQETASSGYDSCPLSPSTTGSNSPRMTDEIQNEGIPSATPRTKTSRMDTDDENAIEQNVPQKKQKKTGKNFPILVSIKSEPAEATITDDKSNVTETSPSTTQTSSPPDKNDDPASSSDNEMSNIPLSQRLKMKKKRMNNRFRLKQSKADRDILNSKDKASTSGPLRREIERIRRALLAKAEGKSPPQPYFTPPSRRITPRNRSRQILGKIKSPSTSPVKKSPLKIEQNGRTPAGLGSKMTSSARKKLALPKNCNAIFKDVDDNTATEEEEFQVPALKLEHSGEDLTEEIKTENVPVEAHSTESEAAVGVIQTIRSPTHCDPSPSSNEGSVVSVNDKQTSSVEVKKKPSVSLQRQHFIEQLLVTKTEQQDEVEPSESESNSQSDSEVASETGSGQIDKSPRPRRTTRSVSSSYSNDNAKGKSLQDKKETNFQRLTVKVERLSHEFTKINGSSTPVLPACKTNRTDQQNGENEKRCPRKRKISPDSSFDSQLEIDVEGCSSESDLDVIGLDDSDAKNAGFSSREIVNKKIKSEASTPSVSKRKMSQGRKWIKASPQSKQTTATASRRKPRPRSKLSSKNAGNFPRDDNPSYSSLPLPHGLKPASCNESMTTLLGVNDDVSYSSHSTAITPENFDNNAGDQGRRLSNRKKALRFGDEWIY